MHRVGHPQRAIGALARLARDARLDEGECFAVARAENALTRSDPQGALRVFAHAHHGRAAERACADDIPPAVSPARERSVGDGPHTSSVVCENRRRRRLRRGAGRREGEVAVSPRADRDAVGGAIKPDPERAIAGERSARTSRCGRGAG